MFTKEGHCALIVAAELAKYYQRRYLSVDEIAKEHHLPMILLQKVMLKMCTVKIIEAENGQQPGDLKEVPHTRFHLSQDPDSLYVIHILKYFSPEDYCGIFLDEKGKWFPESGLSRIINNERRRVEKSIKAQLRRLTIERLNYYQQAQF